MAALGSHRDLIVWQEAMKLVAAVYRATDQLPKREWFGLIAQARRAAVSIPSNIAEGAGRNSTREYVQFLGIATGSLAELETQLELCVILKYLPDDTELPRHVRRVGRLLTALRATHQSRLTTSRFTLSRPTVPLTEA